MINSWGTGTLSSEETTFSEAAEVSTALALTEILLKI
jgi:hypothetical protein